MKILNKTGKEGRCVCMTHRSNAFGVFLKPNEKPTIKPLKAIKLKQAVDGAELTGELDEN